MSSLLSDMPSLLSYPPITDLKDIPEIHNQFVYVIQGYSEAGISMLVYRNNGQVAVQTGDWDGNILDVHKSGHLNEKAKLIVETYLPSFTTLLKVSRIDKAILYFVIEPKTLLVDVRLSLNKFIGPGMLNDIFGKIVETQKILKVVQLDDKIMEAISNNSGSYQGDLILKTSAFKTIIRGDSIWPVYAKVKR